MMIRSNSTSLVESFENEAYISYFNTSTSINKNHKAKNKKTLLYQQKNKFDPRYPKEEAKLKCFEKDAVPVYTEQIFDEYCGDIHGNKYQENSTVTSCCECLL